MTVRRWLFTLAPFVVLACGAAPPPSPTPPHEHPRNDETDPLATRICAAFDAHAQDRSRTVLERRDAIRGELSGDDWEVLDEALEGADSWDQVVTRFADRGHEGFECSTMQGFVTMLLAGEDDTSDATRQRLAGQADRLCTLASEVSTDESIAPSERFMTWMERAAEEIPPGPVRDALESFATSSTLDAALMQDVIGDTAPADWTCAAFGDLFPPAGG